MNKAEEVGFKRAIARARKIMKYRSLGRRYSKRQKAEIKRFEIKWDGAKPFFISRKRGIIELRELHYCVVFPVDPNDCRRPYAKKVQFVGLTNFSAKLNNVGYWVDKQRRIRIRSDLLQSYIDSGTTFKILPESDLDRFVKINLKGNLSPVVYAQ